MAIIHQDQFIRSLQMNGIHPAAIFPRIDLFILTSYPHPLPPPLCLSFFLPWRVAGNCFVVAIHSTETTNERRNFPRPRTYLSIFAGSSLNPLCSET